MIPLFVVGDDHLVRLRAAWHFLRALERHRPLPATDLGLPRPLHHDQPGEGELFDGADHGGVRARGISDRTIVRRHAARQPDPADDPARPPARLLGQFQAGRTCSSPPAISCSSWSRSCRAETWPSPLRGARLRRRRISSACHRRSSPTRSMPAVPSPRPMARPDVAPPELRRSASSGNMSPTCSSYCLSSPAHRSPMFLRARSDSGVRRVALVAAANLAVNLAFFLTHPVVHALLHRSRSPCFRCGASHSRR